MKKRIALRLFCLMISVLLLTACVGCANVPDEPDIKEPADTPEQPEQPEQPEKPSEPEQIDYLLSVPQRDFEQATYTILCRVDKEYEMAGEADSVSLVNEKVLARNNRVQERYNITLDYYPVAGDWSSRATFASQLAQSVAAGDDAYQMAAIYTAYGAELTTQEQFYNLREYEDHINLEAPWWSLSFNENCTVFDKLYFTTGDLSLTMWEGMHAVFFNKELAEDYGVDDLYQLVYDDEWTLEQVIEITAGLYEDDGNDLPGFEDVFGYIGQHKARPYITACDLPICERTADGGYKMVFMDEDHIDKVTYVYDLLYVLLYENDTSFDRSWLPTGAEERDIFTEDRALFFLGGLDNATEMRESEMEFGILPYPKLDENQQTYLSSTDDGLSSFAIPLSAYEPEMCALILDALAAESKTTVIPAYYDVVLQGRVAQDKESKEMLDIIREDLYFDFGFVYSYALRGGNNNNGPYAYFGDSLVRRDASFAVAYDSVRSMHEYALQELMKQFKDSK